MPVGAGRKLFITDRSQYYRDYYQVHKHEYKERYLKSKEKRASGPGNTWSVTLRAHTCGRRAAKRALCILCASRIAARSARLRESQDDLKMGRPRPRHAHTPHPSHVTYSLLGVRGRMWVCGGAQMV